MRRRTTGPLAAAMMGLCLVGCPDETDRREPEPPRIPEPTLEAEDPGAFERAGERLDEAAGEAGRGLQRGGEWIEERTDPDPPPPPR